MVGGSDKRVEADGGSLAEAEAAAAAAEQLAALVEHTSGTVSGLASFEALAISAPEKAAATDRLARGCSKTPEEFGARPVLEVGAIGTHFLPFRKNVQTGAVCTGLAESACHYMAMPIVDISWEMPQLFRDSID